MNKSEQTNLHDLPDEILLTIFSHLIFTQILTLRFVSQKFERLGKDSNLWKQMIEKQYFKWPLDKSNHYTTFIACYKYTYPQLSPKLKPLSRFFAEGNIAEIMKFQLELADLEFQYNSAPALLELINNDHQELLDYFYPFAVKEYLDATCKIQLRKSDKHSRSILHWATRFNNITACQSLISKGCRQEPSRIWGRPIHIAAFYGFTTMVQTLSLLGAPTDIKTPWFMTQMNKEGEMSLELGDAPNDFTEYLLPINLALAKGHVSTVHALLEMNCKFDQKSLCYATLSRKISLVELVKKTFLEPQSHSSINVHKGKRLRSVISMSPLHLSASMGDENMVNYFLEHDADVNCNIQVSHSKLTPLHLAAQFGRLKIVKILLSKGANIDATNSIGETALHISIQCGHTEIVFYLSSKGANQTIKTYEEHWLPIHFAADLGYSQIVNYLLNKNSELIHATTKKNESLLHLAADSGSMETVELILEKNAITIDTIASELKENNLTALFYALRNGHKEISHLLILVGASLEPLIESFDTQHMSALHYAAWFGMLDFVKELLSYHDDVNKKALINWHPHHLATINNHAEVLEVLIKAGAALNTYMTPIAFSRYEFLGIKNNIQLLFSEFSNNCWQAIHFAAYLGHEECTKLLITHRAELNEHLLELNPTLRYRDSNPIYFAISQGHAKIVRALLKANVPVPKRRNIIANEMARDHFEIVLLLLMHGCSTSGNEISKIGAVLMNYAVDRRLWEEVHFLHDRFYIKISLRFNLTGKITVNDLTNAKSHYSSRNTPNFFQRIFPNTEREEVILNLDKAQNDAERFNIAKKFIEENPEDQFSRSLYETIPDLVEAPRPL